MQLSVEARLRLVFGSSGTLGCVVAQGRPAFGMGERGEATSLDQDLVGLLQWLS
jgi:hypothetical protein